MDNNLFICKKCINELRDKPSGTYMQYRGFFSMIEIPTNHICPKCKSNLIETTMPLEDSRILAKIQNDTNFIEAMINLKEKDPIEYQLKMSQFRTQMQQQSMNEKNDNNTIKCPTCNSTKVKRISGTAKVAGAVAFGLFSRTAKSQFKCEKCGYKW